MEQIEEFLRYAKKQMEYSLLELSKKYCDPPKLYKPVWEFVLSGGKRLRPAIVLLAAHTAGNERNAWIPAISIELLHNFTLIHDDIMDRSEFRRQIPTVYKKYGINQAILSGDVLMILAFEILKDMPSQLKPMIFEKLAEAARIVCEGQQYDMEVDWKSVTIKEYLDIVSKKTASLLRISAEIGALTANPQNNFLIKTLGESMFYAGIAFQIIDDFIDLFSEQTGKTRGLDLKEKKPSAIIVAVNQLETSKKSPVWRAISEFINKTYNVEYLIDTMKQFNIDKTVLQLANQYISKAKHLINTANIKNKHLWNDLITMIATRKK